MQRLTLVPFLALAGGCVVSVDGLQFTDSGISMREKAERVDTHALSIAPGETLTIEARHGDVSVEESHDGTAGITATLHALGRTKEEAEEVLARYAVTIERGPDGPTVKLVGEPLRVEEGTSSTSLGAYVDFEATVPAGARLVADSGSGSISARGALGACRLATSYGDVAVDGVRGDVVARSGSGKVIAGDLEGASIELRSGYGSVVLRGARATRIEIESGSGDLALEEARADSLVLKTSYGSVHARSVHGALSASSGSGDVSLRGVHGGVEAKSSYGGIDVDGVLTGLDVESGSGNVFASAREGSTIASAWKLRSNYGAVTLSVPDGFGCALEATTGYGGIGCDFALTIEAGQIDRAKKGSLRGTVGSGGGTVSLSSRSGDVALRKL